MIKQLLTKKNLIQLFSYVGVGGAAALVEWATYYVFDDVCNIFYMGATILAFCCSTTVNWILGRLTTFKDNKYEKKGKEAFLVFCVSAIGLVFNLLLMYLFVSCLNIYGLFAKIIATGIVFIWNFMSRKFFIYKEK